MRNKPLLFQATLGFWNCYCSLTEPILTATDPIFQMKKLELRETVTCLKSHSCNEPRSQMLESGKPQASLPHPEEVPCPGDLGSGVLAGAVSRAGRTHLLAAQLRSARGRQGRGLPAGRAEGG